MVGGGTAIALANSTNYATMMLPMMSAVFQNTEMLPYLVILSLVAINPRMQLIFLRDDKTSIWRNVNFAVFEKFSDGEQRRFINMQNYKNFQKVKTRTELKNFPDMSNHAQDGHLSIFKEQLNVIVSKRVLDRRNYCAFHKHANSEVQIMQTGHDCAFRCQSS